MKELVYDPDTKSLKFAERVGNIYRFEDGKEISIWLNDLDYSNLYSAINECFRQIKEQEDVYKILENMVYCMIGLLEMIDEKEG